MCVRVVRVAEDQNKPKHYETTVCYGVAVLVRQLKQPEQMHMKYSELAPSRVEKIATFLPILHLSNNQKVYLRQPEHFEEIFMTLEMLEEELKILKQELGEAIEEEQEDAPLEEEHTETQ